MIATITGIVVVVVVLKSIFFTYLGIDMSAYMCYDTIDG